MNPKYRGRLSTVDLLVLASSDQMLLKLQTIFTFFCKTSYLNEEDNWNEPSRQSVFSVGGALTVNFQVAIFI
jgi:hypothetical protein